jgi:predicted HNH restriction endonuclease
MQCKKGSGKEDHLSDIVQEDDPGEYELDELRKKAEKEAKENIKRGNANSGDRVRYSRSQKVKEYVLRRADGKCEGCNEPAPFKSKTGDPYLHAHHVYELSEGGSDSPETVIALCPNCHYRVHHGKDGDEYNRYLINKLEQIEN